MTVSQQVLIDGLQKTLDGTNFAGLGTRYEGKVRDNYSTADGKRIPGGHRSHQRLRPRARYAPYKGQVLNSLAAWWFAETKGIAPNHVVSVPDPNVMIGVECEPLKVEMMCAPTSPATPRPASGPTTKREPECSAAIVCPTACASTRSSPKRS